MVAEGTNTLLSPGFVLTAALVELLPPLLEVQTNLEGFAASQLNPNPDPALVELNAAIGSCVDSVGGASELDARRMLAGVVAGLSDVYLRIAARRLFEGSGSQVTIPGIVPLPQILEGSGQGQLSQRAGFFWAGFGSPGAKVAAGYQAEIQAELEKPAGSAAAGLPEATAIPKEVETTSLTGEILASQFNAFRARAEEKEFDTLSDIDKEYIMTRLESIACEIERRTERIYESIARDYYELKGKSPRSEMVAMYLEEINALVQKAIKDGKLSLGKDNKVKILDVATGSGGNILWFIEKYPYYELTAVDKSINMIEQAKSRTDLPHGIIPENFRVMDMRRLDFPDGYFNVVRIQAASYHIPTFRDRGLHEVLREAKRVLAPKGILYIDTRKGEGMVFEDTREGFGPRYFQYYNPDAFLCMIRDSGFEIIRFVDVNQGKRQLPWLVCLARSIPPVTDL